MKKFLVTFAAIAAGFAAQAVQAASTPHESKLSASSEDSQKSAQPNTDGAVKVRSPSGDLFDFVLKRSTENGFLMAEHQSHSSHDSHASHASHSSHYSSR